MKRKLLLLLVMLTSVVSMRGQNEKTAYAYYSWDEGTLIFYYDNMYSSLLEWGVTVYSLNNDNEDPEWLKDENIGTIYHVVFDSSFATAKPTSTKNWFNGMTELTSIEDIQNLNTQEVTDMSGMFSGCSSLTSLSLKNFDTQKVTDMSGMFSGCSSLTKLNLGNFNTQKVTDMSGMFSGCSSLTSLLVSSSLANSVSNLSPDAFEGVGNETNPCLIKQPDNFDFNTDTSGDYFIWLSGYFKIPIKKAYAILSDNTLSFYYDENSDFQEGTTYGLNYSSGLYYEYSPRNHGLFICSFEVPEWLGDYSIFNSNNTSDLIQTVIFDSSFREARPTSTKGWFACMSNLTTIIGIENLKTENVTDMSYMFFNCHSLTNLDLSRFDTHNVTDMRYMFFNYSSPATLDLSNFDTHNVADMSYMFTSYSSTASLNLSQLNTQNVTNMTYMFLDYSSPASLDLSPLNTQNVTDMSGMFYEYSSPASLDLSKLNTQNVTNMNGMFSNYSSPASLDLSQLNTQNVTDMSEMFSSYSSPASLDVSQLNTQNVTNMSYMFYEYSSPASLDVSQLNTQNVTNMTGMFYDCSSLTSLDLSNFNTQNVTSMSYMFYNCCSLTSLDLSNFVFSNKDIYGSGMFHGCESLSKLIIPASANNLYFTACSGIGSRTNPCLINQPDGFDFGVDTSGDYFRWKGGYFKLEEALAEKINVTTDLGYITYCSNKSLNFTNVEGMKAYSVVGYDGKVAKLSRMSIVPAETGLLLKADAGNYEIPYTDEDNYVTNMLVGVLENSTLDPTEGNMTNFVLANGKNGLGFYRLKGSGTLAAHRAYLQVPSSMLDNGAKFISMEFDDETTSISGITTLEEDAPYYDLQGIRHEGKPTKQGIYIKNGKKVVVRD